LLATAGAEEWGFPRQAPSTSSRKRGRSNDLADSGSSEGISTTYHVSYSPPCSDDSWFEPYQNPNRIAFFTLELIPRIRPIKSIAMVVKNRVALPRSPSPLLKKKLAPNRPWSEKICATVLAIVDFPVPAIPFSQNMGLPFLSFAHSVICPSSSTLVLLRHLELCS